MEISVNFISNKSLFTILPTVLLYDNRSVKNNEFHDFILSFQIWEWSLDLNFSFSDGASYGT